MYNETEQNDKGAMAKQRSGDDAASADNSTAADPENTGSAAGSSHRGAKLLILAIIALIVAFGGYRYWLYSAAHPSTKDAYVGANVVRIASMVTGRVTSVYVRDFEHVKAGEVLVRIDPAPFQAALDAANAKLVLARQQANADKAGVAAAKAAVAEAEAKLTNTERQTARTLKLVARGTLAPSQGDDARANLKTAKAAVTAAKAAERQAIAQYGQAGNANAAVKAAAAEVATAKLNLSYTTIKAPASGVLGKVTLRPGAVVAAGTALFPLVDSSRWWVDANFKETDLKHIQPGEKAFVSLDLYPALTLTGKVIAVSPASGVAFSLLPPENATGNWVKVTQRFPVRILLDPPPANAPLRIGASAEVMVNATKPPATTPTTPAASAGTPAAAPAGKAKP